MNVVVANLFLNARIVLIFTECGGGAGRPAFSHLEISRAAEALSAISVRRSVKKRLIALARLKDDCFISTTTPVCEKVIEDQGVLDAASSSMETHLGLPSRPSTLMVHLFPVG